MRGPIKKNTHTRKRIYARFHASVWAQRRLLFLWVVIERILVVVY